MKKSSVSYGNSAMNTCKDMCEELAKTLHELFQKMQTLRINLGFENLRHDSQHVGTHQPFILPYSGMVDARVKNGKVVIEGKDAEFRIYEPKGENLVQNLVEAFLEWARNTLNRLIDNLPTKSGLIEIPDRIKFYSTSKLPPRRPVPIW